MLLQRTNLQKALLQSGSHFLMHHRRIIAFDEIRLVPVTGEQCFQLFMWDARKDGWICDLIAIEVQHRQDRSIANRIQKFIRMPRGCERTSFRLAVAYRDRDDEIRIVERCPVGMRDGVAQFAAFVYRTRRLRSAVRAYSSGKRELAEKLEHASFVGALVRINLGVMALEIAVGKRGGRAMTGAGHVKDIQVVFLDEPIQVHPKEGLAGVGSPVAKQTVLDVLWL